jgi:hypothetical protein
MNKLPSEVKVGGNIFKVEETEGLAANKDAFGCVSFAENIIYIDKSIHKSRKESVLVHEIMEAIFGDLEFEVEHDKLTSIAHVLHQVLVDNKLEF